MKIPLWNDLDQLQDGGILLRVKEEVNRTKF